MRGGIKLHNDISSLFYGGVVNRSGQFDPVGAPKLRNLVFSGTTDEYTADTNDGSALLWNNNIDIKDCQFIANTDGDVEKPHGIEHPLAGTYGYDNLTFSGNDFDAHFIASTGVLTINATNGTDISVATIEELSDAATPVVVNNAVILTLTGIVPGSEVTILEAGTQTEVDHLETLGGDYATDVGFSGNTLSSITIDLSKYVSGDSITVYLSDSNDGTYEVTGAPSIETFITESNQTCYIIDDNITDYEYTYNYPPGYNVDVLVFDIGHLPSYTLDQVLSSTSADIPIQQIKDRVWENPD